LPFPQKAANKEKGAGRIAPARALDRLGRPRIRKEASAQTALAAPGECCGWFRKRRATILPAIPGSDRQEAVGSSPDCHDHLIVRSHGGDKLDSSARLSADRLNDRVWRRETEALNANWHTGSLGQDLEFNSDFGFAAGGPALVLAVHAHHTVQARSPLTGSARQQVRFQGR
jgi:hypothetical protein